MLICSSWIQRHLKDNKLTPTLLAKLSRLGFIKFNVLFTYLRRCLVFYFTRRLLSNY